jgi:hypothetical protein
MTDFLGRFSPGSVVEGRQSSFNLQLIAGTLLMFLIIGFAGIVDRGNPRFHAQSKSRIFLDQPAKPYIYQFDVVSQEIVPTNTLPGTRKIPYIWSQVWESAGWTPKNLMIDKISTSEEFKEIIDMINESSSLLQKRHVQKYLAMAANGGGWLAHSDTFPLHPFGSNIELPEGGQFISYGGPFLISASADEWLRMAKEMAHHARHYHLRDQWTEFLFLSQHQHKHIYQTGEVFEVTNSATDPDSMEWSWSPNDCQATKTKRAVHFNLGEHEPLRNIDKAGDMVIKWLSKWLQSCERSDYFVEKEKHRNLKSADTALRGTTN